ncbi:MAG TPA: carboxypeptidase-like regulatory domain-containing protein [Bryobacteraceae bacterium]|nr:carboxypeptidase-like regulatory domain-containing protein [Bryobacteraceae bacterium]
MLSRSLFALVVLAGSYFTPAAFGQAVAVAEVSGTVTDPSGSAIANASVSMLETTKQLTRSTVTDSSGHYVLPTLPVGPYRLEVRTQGFKDYIQSGIVLQVNNNIQINVIMQVGSISEKIEVSGTTSAVETKENSISVVIDQQRINELPLNGRQAVNLIMSLGAAAYGDGGDTGSKTFYSSTRISVAGGQGNGTAYVLDGGDNTDAMSNVNLPFPFPEALQEFSVETSAVSSRFGTHPGATVNVVTRSGSNAFHGDLFEYLRNGDVNARNFFALQRDSLKRNQYGGVGGGRIIKDKLFFFGGYQGTRNRSNPPSNTTFIPTQAMLTGDFSAVTSAACTSGKPITLYNPSGGAPFANNQIDKNLLNPIAVKIASQYLPIASADQCGKITYGIPITGDEDQWIGRIDFNQSSKNVLFGRYFVDAFKNPPTYDGKNLLTTTQAGNLEMAQSLTIGDNFTFDPRTLNSAHFTFTRRRDNRGPTDIPINPTLLGVNMYSAVPNFLLIAVTGGFSTFCGTCAPGHFNVNAFQGADDVDLIRGRHQIGFGFNLVRVQNNTISGFQENGNFTFNASRTGSTASPGCANCGLGLADFLLGSLSDFNQTNATPDDLRTWIMSFYVQDSFRVNSHFVVNYGVRWEPTFSDPDKYGRGTSFSLAAFNAGQFSKIFSNSPAGLFFKGDQGIPDAMWNGKKANFAPRAGLVWNPHGDGRDTFRVGGALLYDVAETWWNERETTNAPIGTNLDIPNPPGGFSNPWQGFPNGNPFPQSKAFFPSAGIYINMPIDPKPTYVAQWNATYQRQLHGGWMVSASYLGNKTTHLWSSGGEVNPAVYIPGNCVAGQYGLTKDGLCSTTSNTQSRRRLVLLNPTLGPAYASINTMDDGAVAHYNGLLLSVQRRFANNFSFNANYTDSTCVSDADFGAALANSTNSQPFNRHADWGPCVFDTRHNFNTSLIATSSYKGSNVWMNRLLSDWSLAPLIHASSGQPLTVTTGKDNSLTAINGSSNDRPNQVLPSVSATNPICNNGTTPCVQWLNALAYVPNPLGTYGNVGRGAARGPNTFNFDVALSRTFKLTERFSLQARAEAFNLLNHTNLVGAISPAGTVSAYTTLDTNLSSSTFGRSRAAFDPRIIQFAMKLHF